MSIETQARTVKLFVPKFGEVREINATDEQFFRCNYQALSPAEHEQFLKDQAKRDAEHAAHEAALEKKGKPFQTKAEKTAADGGATDTPQ